MSKKFNCQDLIDYLKSLQSKGFKLDEVDMNYIGLSYWDKTTSSHINLIFEKPQNNVKTT